jgi:predicted  nucleic acid-binding Zn-ribbon protein
MSSRVLTILNALGCLALTGLIAMQWLRERDLESEITTIAKDRDSARKEVHSLESRRAALERDIALLKDSLAATQQAAESAARELTEKSAITHQLETDLATARSQIEAWETAVKERDTRITTLQTELTKTRARLDEAIAKLKQASAR